MVFETTKRWNCSYALGALIMVVLPNELEAQDVTFFAGVDYFSKEFLTMGEFASAYGEASGAAGFQTQMTNFELLLSVGYADDDRDSQELRFDNSKVEFSGDGWHIGLGQVARHWSPSKQTSLILGTNSRPLPAVYGAFGNEMRSDRAWLAWLGPWKFETFLGDMGGSREVDNPRLFGARFEAEPIDGFDFALSFTGQYGGDGYDEGFSTFWDMLFGNTNADGDEGIPNRLAGLELSYDLPDDMAPLRVYGQAIGEDEANNRPSKFMYMAGVEYEGSLQDRRLRVALEFIDTDISNCRDCAYNNGAYPSGYTYRGRTLGAAIDTAGHAVQLHGELELNEVDVLFTGGFYDINRTSNPDQRLSSKNVDGVLVAVTTRRAFDWGDVRVGVNYQSFDLDNAGLDSGVGVHVGVGARF